MCDDDRPRKSRFTSIGRDRLTKSCVFKLQLQAKVQGEKGQKALCGQRINDRRARAWRETNSRHRTGDSAGPKQVSDGKCRPAVSVLACHPVLESAASRLT